MRFASTALIAFACCHLSLAGAVAQSDVPGSRTTSQRDVVLELYLRDACATCAEVQQAVSAFMGERQGVRLSVQNLDQGASRQSRFQDILKSFRVESADPPVLYGCNSLLLNLKSDDALRRRLNALLTVDVYFRTGCPHCDRAKRFLATLEPHYPGLRFQRHDIALDSGARERVQELARRYRKQAASVPVIHFCNQLSIGWVSDETTGKHIESVLRRWTIAGPTTDRTSFDSSVGHSERIAAHTLRSPAVVLAIAATALWTAHGPTPVAESAGRSASDQAPSDPLPSAEPLLPLPGDEAEPPPGQEGPPTLDDEVRPPPQSGSDVIDLPLLGKLSKSRLGMPAFTFVVGLVDGFNPCAMWVLLFLLSVLVNLKSRSKILAVAGTFVVVSAVAYFAFMAAWLNIFLLIGYLRSAQIALGILAVVIGAIHIKDFFAFRQGISLSIPESAKPGIYARVRRIVTAENVLAAIGGAIVLAVLVNIVELLCTAGLPALYTEILMMQSYPAWKNYAYLALYNVAYMLDDGIMVAIVVVTLGRRKLQERQGRWLKLISGAMILVLGLIMIIKPEWLI